ncbi:MAG: hypothetical protein ACPGEF_04455, partial [Endozoicomonas sp.]
MSSEFKAIIRQELEEAAIVLNRFLNDEANLDAIDKAARLLSDSFKDGSKVL